MSAFFSDSSTLIWLMTMLWVFVLTSRLDEKRAWGEQASRRREKRVGRTQLPASSSETCREYCPRRVTNEA